MAKGNKTRVTGGQIMGFIALLMVVVLVVVWSIGSNGFTNNNPAKWDWWQSESKDNPAEGGDNVTPTDEGILMFKPITTVDSPVALAAETAAGSNTVTLTATLEPENAFYYSATWRSSSNALTVTQDEEDPLKATVELTGTLTETAQITCVVESFKTVTATCTVDYLETSFSSQNSGFKEIVSQDSKYANPTKANKNAFAFGTEYLFSAIDYASSKSTVQGTYVITKIDLKLMPSFSTTDTFVNEMNSKLKISDTEWFKNEIITLYERSDGVSETFTFPATLEELIGKPSDVSSDDLAKAYYQAYGKISVFMIQATIQIVYNDVVYKTCNGNMALVFVPESYLTGVDGVTILPGGGVVMTD